MAKRLTDTEKWEDPWFQELPNEHKLLWIFILDKCDHAGFWKVNKRLAEFCLNQQLDLAGFLEACNGRISIKGEKWFIPKFIFFQYGLLREDCRPHRAVIEVLKNAGIKGYQYPIDTDTDKDKDKDKDKDSKQYPEETANPLFSRITQTQWDHLGSAFDSLWVLERLKGYVKRATSKFTYDRLYSWLKEDWAKKTQPVRKVQDTYRPPREAPAPPPPEFLKLKERIGK